MTTEHDFGGPGFRRANAEFFGLPAAPKATLPYTAPPKKLVKQSTKGPNKWEAEFEEYLRHELRPIHEIMPQRVGLKLGNGVVYWPDVVTTCAVDHTYDPETTTQIVEAWEVKGFRRALGIAKIKIAASQNPWITFYLVSKKTNKQGGGWNIQRILP